MDNNVYVSPESQATARETRNLLAQKATWASDGFRQWLYTRNHRFSIVAQLDIVNLANQGHDAFEIASRLYAAHS